MMKVLENKIDFVALISVTNANPNGDPLNGNRPRTTYTGNGKSLTSASNEKSAAGCRIWAKAFSSSRMNVATTGMAA